MQQRLQDRQTIPSGSKKRSADVSATYVTRGMYDEGETMSAWPGETSLWGGGGGHRWGSCDVALFFKSLFPCPEKVFYMHHGSSVQSASIRAFSPYG